MDWGGPGFVLAIIMLSTGGWLINNWIRAKHGYDLEDEWGGKTAPKKSKEVAELRAENAELVQLLKDQGKRMETLERIVTDKGYRLNEEIEALRDVPDKKAHDDSGVPLNISKKEHI
ncbi:hypothetical protein [Pontixanthobacter aquaemixtae]|uniref:Phage shock protein B n=1 Tax=Pontixanthobacter aquaemixtae TaxID=1958940 RepID=A0A844ZRJ4_9SPHN|nr:hypothetical protein [Pontixanthobacter aquaemixtae]MXO90941.1 hypothetical protein [Pontixanthobacter aquaemixtae]